MLDKMAFPLDAACLSSAPILHIHCHTSPWSAVWGNPSPSHLDTHPMKDNSLQHPRDVHTTQRRLSQGPFRNPTSMMTCGPRQTFSGNPLWRKNTPNKNDAPCLFPSTIVILNAMMTSCIFKNKLKQIVRTNIQGSRGLSSSRVF